MAPEREGREGDRLVSIRTQVDTLIGTIFLVGAPVAASYYAGTIASESSRAALVPFITFGLVYLIALVGVSGKDDSE